MTDVKRSFPMLPTIESSDSGQPPSPFESGEPTSAGNPTAEYELRTTTYCDGTLHILYSEREFTDVVFICEDGSNVQAHKFILAARSEFFRDLLYRRGDNLDENCKVKTYNFSATRERLLGTSLPGLNASRIVLELIMEYLYTGQIAEFECNAGVIDEDKEKLWTSVLSQALEKSLGGLDVYLRALLVRCRPTEHHVSAGLLAFAMGVEPKLMDVAQSMVSTLVELPFSEDCFKKMPEPVVEVVLDTVPFQVLETEVIKAVAQWVKADCMEDDDELGGTALSPTMLSRIDLGSISPVDLVDIVVPLDMLDDKALTDAYIMHALRPPDNQIVTCINPLRGAQYNWGSQQTSPLLDDELAKAILLQWQQYTTFGPGRRSLSTNDRNMNTIAE